MMKISKKTILLLLPLLILALSSLFVITHLPLFVKDNALSELSTDKIEQKVEYASERGFGSDRYDIYSFSLTDKKEELNHFQKLDNLYYENYKYRLTGFNQLFSKEDMVLIKEKIYPEITTLEKTMDTQYLYYEKDNTRKLYIYSKSANKGYCFILII